MIEFTSGNLLKAPAEALINTVNTEGVMGKGIAYQFKQAHPKMYEDYAQACKKGQVQLGRMHVYELGHLLSGPKFIINFPTKGHWRARSRLRDVETGLQDLVRVVRELGIKSIAIPPLGCGNGGLNWNDVRPLIEGAFAAIPGVHAYVYPPEGAPSATDMARATTRPKMTSARAVLIALMDRYVKGLLEPFVTLLEVQKLLYFMQEAGEPLKLDFQQARYGPFATNLRFELARMEGHFITGFGDAEEKPGKVLELLEGANDQATNFLMPREDSAKRMDRVALLIEGFEDSHGMELLSTVHWVMVRDEQARSDLNAAIRGVHAWSGRKQELMTPEQIEAAWKRLVRGDWHFMSASMQ